MELKNKKKEHIFQITHTFAHTKSQINITMQTTPPKREKRSYIKKRLLTQDELWKLIIPILWKDFIYYFLPEWVVEIDFSRKPDFLDKDLKKLMPTSKSKNRAVDILMRVYFKNGASKTFLLHIEIQAYFERFFTKRVFQYYYRISDLLQEAIETLVIMIDDDANYRPNEHFEQFGQTSVLFKYRLFKLLDNPPPYKANNIFSIVLEVAWYALKQNMLKNDSDLETLKFRLIKKLLENDIEDEKIYAILSFINIYLPFENPENDLIFVEKLDKIIFKDNIMEAISIRDYIIQKYEAQAQRRVKRVENQLKKVENQVKLAEGQVKAAENQVKAAENQVKAAENQAKAAENQAKAAENQAKAAENQAKAAENQAKAAENQAKAAENQLAMELRNTVLQLHAKGFDIETIADVMSKPLAFVLKILENPQNIQTGI
jgi:hypothetical protein